MICRRCGKANRDDAAFCGFCGGKLESLLVEEEEPKSQNIDTNNSKGIRDAIPEVKTSERKEPSGTNQRKRSGKPVVIVLIALALICAAIAGVLYFRDNSGYFKPIELLDKAFTDSSPEALKEAVSPDYLERTDSYLQLMGCTYMKNTQIKDEKISNTEISGVLQSYNYSVDPNDRYHKYYVVTTHREGLYSDNSYDGYYYNYLIGKTDDKWEIMDIIKATVSLKDTSDDCAKSVIELLNNCEEDNYEEVYDHSILKQFMDYNWFHLMYWSVFEENIYAVVDGLKQLNQDSLCRLYSMSNDEKDLMLEVFKTQINKGEDWSEGDKEMVLRNLETLVEQVSEIKVLCFDDSPNDDDSNEKKLYCFKFEDKWYLGYFEGFEE